MTHTHIPKTTQDKWEVPLATMDFAIIAIFQASLSWVCGPKQAHVYKSSGQPTPTIMNMNET